MAVDLADRRVDIDDEPPVAGASARRPRPHGCLIQNPVE